MLRAPLLLLAALLAGCTEPSVTLTTTPDTVLFNGFGATPDPQGLQLISAPGSLPWTATSDSSWLSVLPPSGTSTPAVMLVQANPTGMPGGVATATLRLSVSDKVLAVPVILAVPLAQGTWTGTVLGSTGLELDLKDSSGVISGSGAFVGAGGARLPLLVGGVHAHPTVIFSLNSAGFAPATVSAVFVTPTVLSGTITGSSFTGDPLILSHP